MAIDADITHTLRPLINGISSKPAIERLDSQGEDQVNFLSDPARGLKRRPGTEFIGDEIAADIGSVLGKYFYHIIEGTDDESFLLIIADQLPLVYDLATGASQTITTPDGVAYLDDPASNNSARRTFELFAASTTLDTTFITNRTTTPLMETTTSPSRPNQMLMYLKKVLAGQEYELIIEGRGTSPLDFSVLVASDDTDDITPDGTRELISKAAGFKAGLDALIAIADPPGPTLNWPTAGGGPEAGGFGLIARGSMIFGLQDPTVTNDWSDGTDRVEANDDQGNTSLFAWNEKVQAFKDLPAQGPDGFVFEITGEEASNFDNYWVVFEEFSADDDQPVNRWRETVRPNIKVEIDGATMPHRLVHTGAGAFTFEEIPWAKRLVGDAKSAPFPSFISEGSQNGAPIKDLTVFANRLFMVAGENLIGSENGKFFNFWPTTVAAVIDSDPVDVSGATNESAEWDWLTPYSETLILHSSSAPLQSRYGKKGDAITPTTPPPKPVSAYSVSPHVRPIVLGNKLFVMGTTSDDALGSINGTYEINELFIDQNDNVQANPLLLNNPEMMSRDIINMTGSASLGLLIVYSDGRGPWVYTFKEDQGQKIQGGWSNWRIGLRWDEESEGFAFDSPRYLEFSKERLITVTSQNIELHKIDFTKAQTDSFSSINQTRSFKSVNPELLHLDWQAQVVGSYNLPADITTWTLPYDISIGSSTFPEESWHAIGLGGDFRGQRLEGLTWTNGSNVVTKNGDFSVNTLFGVNFVSLYDLGEITVPSGDKSAANRTHGHLNIKRFITYITRSGPFEAEVTFTDSPDDKFISQMSNLELVGEPDPTGSSFLRLTTGEFQFDAGGSSDVTRVRLITNSFLPLNIHAIEWQGRFYARARQT